MMHREESKWNDMQLGFISSLRHIIKWYKDKNWGAKYSNKISATEARRLKQTGVLPIQANPLVCFGPLVPPDMFTYILLPGWCIQSGRKCQALSCGGRGLWTYGSYNSGDLQRIQGIAFTLVVELSSWKKLEVYPFVCTAWIKHRFTLRRKDWMPMRGQ